MDRQESWEAWNEQHRSQPSPILTSQIMRLVNQMSLPRHAKVLELGCGVGNLGVWFAGCEMHGVDIDGQALGEAKAHGYKTTLCDLRSFNPKRYFCKSKSARILPRGKIAEHYDLVFSFGLFEHLEEKEMIAVCRKLGTWADRVLIVVPSTTGFRGLVRKIIPVELSKNLLPHKLVISAITSQYPKTKATGIYYIPRLPLKIPVKWFWAISGETR